MSIPIYGYCTGLRVYSLGGLGYLRRGSGSGKNMDSTVCGLRVRVQALGLRGVGINI